MSYLKRGLFQSAPDIKCLNCGYEGKSKWVSKGSTFVELLLWFCFILPGVFYSLWRRESSGYGCARCKSDNIYKLLEKDNYKNHEKHSFSSNIESSKHIEINNNRDWDTENKENTKKDKNNTMILVGSIIGFLIGIGSNGLAMILAFTPLVGIWLYNKKSDKHSDTLTKVQNFKKYKGRTILSIIVLLFSGLVTFGKFLQINEATPTLLVNGGEAPNIGNNTGYTLNISLKDAGTLYVNGGEVKFTGNQYLQTFDLTNKTSETISIKAINSLKETAKSITVNRSLSQTEVELKKAQELEAQKQAEIEKKKQEAYMKSPEYKAEQAQALKVKLNKLMEEKQSDLKFSCTEGVKSLLKSPSSADFPSILEFAYGLLNDQILVQSYVDSQNSFGAQIRTTFTCFFNVGANDSLSLVDVKFAE